MADFVLLVNPYIMSDYLLLVNPFIVLVCNFNANSKFMEVCVQEQDALYVLHPVCNVIHTHRPWKGDARPRELYAGPMEVCVQEQDALYVLHLVCSVIRTHGPWKGLSLIHI